MEEVEAKPYLAGTDGELTPEMLNLDHKIDLSDCELLDIWATIDKPPALLKIKDVEFLTRYSINVVSGKAKQGKTQWLMLLLSRLISREDGCGIEWVSTQKPLNIVYIDSEQADYSVQLCLQRAVKSAGIRNDAEHQHFSDLGMKVYLMAQYSATERYSRLKEAVDSNSEAIPIDVLIIDGIRDFVTSINDEEQATSIVDYCYRLLKDGKVSIIIVNLHENEGNDKIRGFLGTEFKNKLTDLFTVRKVNDDFEVEHVSRNRQFGKFLFTITAEGTYNTAIYWPRTKEDWKMYSVNGRDGKERLWIEEQLVSRTGCNIEDARAYVQNCLNEGILYEKKNQSGDMKIYA